MSDDWEPLGEDATSHSMMGFYTHSDGRTCMHHSRLAAWVFGYPATNMKCLREHS